MTTKQSKNKQTCAWAKKRLRQPLPKAVAAFPLARRHLDFLCYNTKRVYFAFVQQLK